MENWVFDFIARWRHLCYKFVHYRVNRRVPNKITLKSAKNHTNWFIRFEDMSRWPRFFGPPCIFSLQLVRRFLHNSRQMSEWTVTLSLLFITLVCELCANNSVMKLFPIFFFSRVACVEYIYSLCITLTRWTCDNVVHLSWCVLGISLCWHSVGSTYCGFLWI